MYPTKSIVDLLSITILPSNLSILVIPPILPLTFISDLRLSKLVFEIKSELSLKSVIIST